MIKIGFTLKEMVDSKSNRRNKYINFGSYQNIMYNNQRMSMEHLAFKV